VLTSLVPRPFTGSLAARERGALASLALSLGATAPTMCDGWTVKDMVIHLLARERHPLARERASTALASRDLSSLVAQLRSVPLALSVIDPALNGMEMFVHHEDVRRAQPSWTVRPLSRGDERTLWLSASLLGRVQGRRIGVPLEIRSGSRHAVLRSGPSPVVVSGPVSEVLLFLCGRGSVASVTVDGPADAISRVKAATLSV